MNRKIMWLAIIGFLAYQAIRRGAEQAQLSIQNATVNK